MVYNWVFKVPDFLLLLHNSDKDTVDALAVFPGVQAMMGMQSTECPSFRNDKSGFVLANEFNAFYNCFLMFWILMRSF